MRVVTVVQTKGGSGKTTTAMGIASAAMAEGEKVTMIDADVNAQLSGWRQAFEEAAWSNIEHVPWPDTLSIEPAPGSVDDLYARIEALDAEGCDLLVIDTRPGTNLDTENLALAADVIVVPAKPVQGEWRLVVDTMNWLSKLFETLADDEPRPAARMLLTNVPPKIMSSARRTPPFGDLTPNDRHIINTLLPLPRFDVLIANSKILEGIAAYGPLPTAIEMRKRSPAGRIQVGPVEDQLAAFTQLYDEIKEAV